MRIAFVTTSYPRDEADPSGHFVQTEVQGLEAAGHDVIVIRPETGGAFGWPGVAARVRERWARGAEAGAWVLRARRELVRARADRVVAHWALPSAWPIAVPGCERELDVVSHGGDVRLLVQLPASLRERIVSAVAERAARWRFVSQHLLDTLLAGVGPSRARVERVAEVRPAFLTIPDVRAAAADKKRALEGLRCAVTVGRLVPSKRVDRIIVHMALTRAADVLVVVGDGPERARLEELARERGVEARFVGLVAREEALAWMSAADVLFHASEQEGLSSVLREAEALGVRSVVLRGSDP